MSNASRAIDALELRDSGAERFWQQLADGNVSDADAARWAKILALRVTQDVQQAPAKDRPARALRALSLSGRRSGAFLQEVAVMALEDLELRPAQIYEICWLLGDIPDEVTPEQVRNKVNNVRKALKST